MLFWTPTSANLAPTWPQLSLQNPSKTGLKTMLKCNFLKSWFLQLLPCEMFVFASARDSQNDQKCVQKQLVIRVPFQLRKNTLPASIFLQLGSLLGLPRHPQGASKASLKPLLEASWAKLKPSSIFCLPGGTPWPNLYIFLNIFLLFFQLLNVTIGFHGLPLWGFVCISYLQNRLLPRRSGRSPLEFLLSPAKMLLLSWI